MRNTRDRALNIVYDVLYKGAFLNEELTILREKNLDSRDYRLIANITTGTIQNKFLLDWLIKKYSKIKFKKIHKMILTILEMGIYQILFLDRTKDFAAIDESVKLASRYGNKGSKGFVNAILRNISREKDEIISRDFLLDELRESDFRSYLSIRYSHPEFYIDEMLKYNDEEFVEKLLIANNTEPPFTIRVNNCVIETAELKEKLEKLGYEIEIGNISKNCLKIKNPESIFETDSFKSGEFYVQDEASIYVSELVNTSGDILDLCAAPGGKSIGASINNQSANILSCDISNKKVEIIRENIQRLGLKNIRTIKNDATIFNESFENSFDHVIVDAPCSGLGLYRKKPEIKILRTYEEVKELSKIQRQILSNATRYVKIGGRITYSTCTLTREENEEVLNSVLDENFEIERLNSSDFLRLYPSDDGTDGFTIASIRRIR